MLSKLLPQETKFFDYFEKHAALSVQAAKILAEAASSPAPLTEAAARVKELETQGDEITHACVSALHQTFITPLDRDAIHRLIKGLDDILDLMDEASRRLELYEITTLTPMAVKAAEILYKCTQAIERALGNVRHLTKPERILEECVRINRLENEGDSIYEQALGELFKHERDPIKLIKWREIYESFENAIDVCDELANLIEGIVLEHV